MPGSLLTIIQNILQQGGENHVAIPTTQSSRFSHVLRGKPARRTLVRNRWSGSWNQKGFGRNLLNLVLHCCRRVLLPLARRQLGNRTPDIEIHQILLGQLGNALFAHVHIDRLGVHKLAQMTGRLVAWTEGALHN